jgi:adenylate cyclase
LKKRKRNEVNIYSKGSVNMSLEQSLLLLEETYFKIAKINIEEDTYEIIKPEDEETYASYSEWIIRFVAKGSIHREDVEEFLSKTSL